MACSINASIASTGIITSADATGILQLQTDGTTGLTLGTSGDITIANNLVVSGSNVRPLVSGTSQASTSGTSIDFTSIPTWVKRITVIFSGVSTNGTSTRRIQIGAGSVTTSGYTCAFGYATTGVGSSTSTTGFDITNGSAAEALSGHMTITNISGNIWVESAVFATTGGTAGLYYSGGTVTLSGTLDRVRVTTLNGTDAFDAGTINIMYE